MNISIILIGILTVASVSSVIYLLLQKTAKTAAVRWAVAVIMCALLWTICNYFILKTNTTVGTILNSAAFTIGFLTLYSLFMLAQYYPVKSQHFKFDKARRYHIAAVLFALVSALPAIAGKVVAGDGGTLYYTDPPLVVVYVAVAFFLIVLTIFRFAQIAHETKGAVRAQAILLMIGLGLMALFALGASTVLPLFDINVSYQTFGPMIIIMALVFISYVLSRKAIFDVRPYLARSFVYLFSIGVLIALFITLTAFAAQYLFATSIHSPQTWFFAGVSIMLALLFRPIVGFFNEFTARYFYRHDLDAQSLTNTVNKKLVDSEDLHDQLAAIAELIRVNLSVVYVNFYINPQPPLHRLLTGTQVEIFKNEPWHELHKHLELMTQNTLLAETFHDTEDKTVSDIMRRFECALVQKLVSQGEVVGYAVIGYHRGGNSITSNELQVIETIADEVAIAVQNSRRLLQISKFNTTLKHEISLATAELKSSNQKLLALDEAKDEFISMASHQLRTPLTSIKGYLSMVLDGDVGIISEPQRNFLTQAFVSSQHMAYLIGDLLNLSRIKTGKFVVSAQPTYLPDVVQSEVEPLMAIAKARRVTLVYKSPDNFPTIDIDESKIRQVIMNFVENGIYYTPANGRVDVHLRATKKGIEFTVQDTGIGVSKSEQKHMFDKFYRAQNARRMRPDGTGIGLYMAKRVIDAHGGTLIFSSTEGKGSTFGFMLPLK